VIEDYEKWLHHTANRLGNVENHDDLVQEGRVAMWRAMETFDASRGALPTWLTRAAEQRMKDVALGRGQPFGHEAVRGSREVEMGPSLDGAPEGEVEALLGYVEAAYHDGEVMRIVRECLTPEQQQYVFLRFWGGLDPRTRQPAVRALVRQFPVLADHRTWQQAKAILADRLGHLAA
jgi:RNA polymerase sigma factor (sigma-70 family)